MDSKDKLQFLLQVSAKLYKHLTDIPSSDDRDAFIEKTHLLLDERSEIITELQNENVHLDRADKSHLMLIELDKGIKIRLEKVLESIQIDLKTIKVSKKNTNQYVNPYASVEVMDGRYYDKKN